MIEASNGRDVSDYTAYAKENEIILPIGTKLKVKSDPLQQQNNFFIVHLIEIDDEHDQQEKKTVWTRVSGFFSNAKERWDAAGERVAAIEDLPSPGETFLTSDQITKAYERLDKAEKRLQEIAKKPLWT
ncbi:unnamed protein product [Adineta ricciae]|nr:unnamed protein product [Adineta ricciae]